MNILPVKHLNQAERDVSCDIARGIGIIFVVWGHLKSCPIHDEIYLFHMPLFFLLSGFFMSTRRSFKTFLCQKIRFLIGPFFLFYFASLIYGAIRSGNFPLDYIHSLNGRMMSPNAPLWFLLSLFEISILTYIIEKFVTVKIVKISIVLAFILIGYAMAMKGIRIHGGISQTFLCYIFFQIGYWGNQYKWGRYLSSTLFLFLIFGYILGIILNVKTDINLMLIDVTYILFFIPALCGALLVIYVSKSCAKFQYTRWLAYLGRNSLLILCTHVPVIITFYNLVDENERFGDITILLILFPISLCIGVLFKKFFPYFFKEY